MIGLGIMTQKQPSAQGQAITLTVNEISIM